MGSTLDAVLERRFAGARWFWSCGCPGGQRLPGPNGPRWMLRLQGLGTLAHLATGQIGRVGEDYVEGRLDFDIAARP